MGEKQTNYQKRLLLGYELKGTDFPTIVVNVFDHETDVMYLLHCIQKENGTMDLTELLSNIGLEIVKKQ